MRFSPPLPAFVSFLSAIVLTFGSSLVQAATDTTQDQNKKIVEIWLKEVIDDEEHGRINELLDEKAVLILSPSMKSPVSHSNKVKGLENIRKHREIRAKVSDLDFEIKEIVAEGDSVAVFCATTSDDENGKATYPSVTLFKLKDGKIREIRVLTDNLHARLPDAK